MFLQFFYWSKRFLTVLYLRLSRRDGKSPVDAFQKLFDRVEGVELSLLLTKAAFETAGILKKLITLYVIFLRGEYIW